MANRSSAFIQGLTEDLQRITHAQAAEAAAAEAASTEAAAAASEEAAAAHAAEAVADAAGSIVAVPASLGSRETEAALPMHAATTMQASAEGAVVNAAGSLHSSVAHPHMPRPAADTPADSGALPLLVGESALVDVSALQVVRPLPPAGTVVPGFTALPGGGIMDTWTKWEGPFNPPSGNDARHLQSAHRTSCHSRKHKANHISCAALDLLDLPIVVCLQHTHTVIPLHVLDAHALSMMMVN